MNSSVVCRFVRPGECVECLMCVASLCVLHNITVNHSEWNQLFPSVLPSSSAIGKIDGGPLPITPTAFLCSTDVCTHTITSGPSSIFGTCGGTRGTYVPAS